VYMPIWNTNQELENIWNNFKDILFSHQRQHDRVHQFHIHGGMV
jgi:hypothetical protein